MLFRLFPRSPLLNARVLETMEFLIYRCNMWIEDSLALYNLNIFFLETSYTNMTTKFPVLLIKVNRSHAYLDKVTWLSS